MVRGSITISLNREEGDPPWKNLLKDGSKSELDVHIQSHEADCSFSAQKIRLNHSLVVIFTTRSHDLYQLNWATIPLPSFLGHEHFLTETTLLLFSKTLQLNSQPKLFRFCLCLVIPMSIKKLRQLWLDFLPFYGQILTMFDLFCFDSTSQKTQEVKQQRVEKVFEWETGTV